MNRADSLEIVDGSVLSLQLSGEGPLREIGGWGGAGDRERGLLFGIVARGARQGSRVARATAGEIDRFLVQPGILR